MKLEQEKRLGVIIWNRSDTLVNSLEKEKLKISEGLQEVHLDLPICFKPG